MLTKKKRFSVGQIVGALKQAGVGVPVVVVIREAGISKQAFYQWKAKYIGLEVARLGVTTKPSRRIVEVDPHDGHIVSQMEATALGVQPAGESNGRFTFLTADQETGFLEIVDVKLHWLVVRKNAARGRATLTLPLVQSTEKANSA